MSKRSRDDSQEHYETRVPDQKKRFINNTISPFRVRRSEEYEGSFPVYKQPQELTSYSIDCKRRVWFDNREMKYYYPPTSGKKDLSAGYDQFIQRDESVLEHIDTLLDALTHYNSTTEDKATADIITWRGIMSKILCTPYSRKEPWELRATRHNGTIFMEEQVTKEKKIKEERATDRQKLMSYWGYRFESLCTTKNPPDKVTKQELEQRLIDSANTNVQYCILVKTKLGNNSIIMGAEVDCCRDVKPEDPLKQPSNYIELKTSRIIESARHQYSFDRYKLLKFWAQSFLVGVPRIMCGFRDDSGHVIKIEQLKTLEIPRHVRGKMNIWNPSVCLNFAKEVLDWIKSSIIDDDASVTYSIQYQYPFEEITIKCTGHSNIFMTQRYLDATVQHDIGGPRVTPGFKS